MKLGTLDIKKAYLGAFLLTHNNAFIQNEALIPFADREVFYFLTNATSQNPAYVGLASLSSNQTLQYSRNGSSWTSMDINTSIQLDDDYGQKVYIRGKLTENNSTSSYTKFTITGGTSLTHTDAYGNIMCLYDYETLPTTIAYDYAFLSLFQDSDIYTADIFNYVSSITGSNCCLSMFKQCGKLIYSPNLPATTLGYACYQEMFKNCTSLTSSGSLPATSLTTNCYAWMLQGCTSLTTAPELLATTPTTGSYRSMFYGCSSLNYIKCLATDISASNCVYNWVDGVAASGTFVKHPDATSWTSGTSGIPDNWTVQ